MNNKSPCHSCSDAHYWLVLVCLLVGILFLAACGDHEPAPLPTATVAPVTVEIGGMTLAAASGATTTPGTPAAVGGTAVTPTLQEVLAPDTKVVAGGVLRFYADADPTAPRLAEYAAGTTFVVVEPGGDYTAYPVDMNGVRWYRVRAADDLVGWVMADAVSPAQ